VAFIAMADFIALCHLLVGISALNLVFVRRFSSLPQQFPGLLVDSLPYADISSFSCNRNSLNSCQAAISNMEGIGGKPAWAWIFILEGLATVLAGAASFWIIQDFPDTAKFLSEAERTFVIRRLQGDDQFSAAGEQLKMKYIYKSLLDRKTWIGSMSSMQPM
jgi:hypothetical protein